jgi:hypothetical protein
MSLLEGVALADDVAAPAPVSAAVKKRLDALFADKKQLRRLYGIARKIVRSSGQIKRRNVEGVGDDPLYSNALLDDLIYEAVMRVLDGRRRWDIDKQPDPHVYLGGVIGSLWTHFARDEKARRKREAAEPEEEAFDWRSRRTPNPLELLIAKEEEEEFQLLRQDFAAEFKATDTRAHAYLALTQEEIYDPSEQAKRLGITIEETYTLRARIKRVLDRFIEQQRKRKNPR